MARNNSNLSKPDQVFLEACNIYFRHCHNKPYGFFNAELFQHKLTTNQIPLHLRLALIATATRYSSRSQWQERKQSTIDSYARCAWEMITTSPEGLDDTDDVTVIQTLALLAVIDATAGRRRGAWVKIGMAVRISQDLQMMLEPGMHLSELEQDERRNLFWSLYLLDRFVCCSFQRPPAINDSDCLLKLPTYRAQGKRRSSCTLTGLLDKGHHDLEPPSQPGMFGISIGLASLLGRTIKCMMSENPQTEAPWQPESEYCAIYNDLERLKKLAVKNSPVLANPGQPTSPSEMPFQDREQTAHMVLSHTLYHLAHCILSHPFLLARKLQSIPHSVTLSAWLENTRTTGLVHAGSLITVLVEAKAAGYMPVPSVYSYCVLVASTIHALHLYSDDVAVNRSSAEYLKTSLEYLSEISELWGNAQMMANALKAFTRQCPRYSDILLRNHPRIDELTTTEIRILKSVVDYWEMMNPKNPVFDMAPSEAFAVGPHSEKGDGISILTPPSSEIMDGITISIDASEVDESKTEYSVDPDIIVGFPVPAMSPMPSDDGCSPRWDWDSELIAWNE